MVKASLLTFLSGVLFAVSGMLFLFGFILSGSYVDESGLLVEEFWALGLSALMFVASFIAFTVWLFLRFKLRGVKV